MSGRSGTDSATFSVVRRPLMIYHLFGVGKIILGNPDGRRLLVLAAAAGPLSSNGPVSRRSWKILDDADAGKYQDFPTYFDPLAPNSFPDRIERRGVMTSKR